MRTNPDTQIELLSQNSQHENWRVTFKLNTESGESTARHMGIQLSVAHAGSRDHMMKEGSLAAPIEPILTFAQNSVVLTQMRHEHAGFVRPQPDQHSLVMQQFLNS